MQEASHRLGFWALEEACSGSSSGVRNRIIKLVKLQWRDQSPFSYAFALASPAITVACREPLAADAVAANEERASHAAWPCTLCARWAWQEEYRYLIKELKQEYMLAAVLVDASCAVSCGCTSTDRLKIP